jgi:hypothetical protein
MSKYIIEINDNAVPSASNCYHIVGTNSVLVSTDGLDGLKKYEEKDNSLPQLGDGYFVIYNDGCVGRSTYENDCTDLARIEMGNCFRTEKEAEFAVERLKVLAEMKKFAEPSDTKWDGNTRHYFICYDIEDKCLRVDNHTLMWGGEICFESDKRAKECIDIVGKDRIKKYYIGVE